MPKVNYLLMYVTDERITNNTAFFNILYKALQGGATCIQLREKTSDTANFYQRAVKAKTLCQEFNVPLIINDRIDIALAVNADGVHIGQKDLPFSLARKLLGHDKIIGLSISSKEQALEANILGADYIGLSPIFETQTKTSDLEPPLGIKGLKEIAAIAKQPVVCIGGIELGNAQSILQHGATGIAVVSAISRAKDVKKETQKLKEILCQTGTQP